MIDTLNQEADTSAQITNYEGEPLALDVRNADGQPVTLSSEHLNKAVSVFEDMSSMNLSDWWYGRDDPNVPEGKVLDSLEVNSQDIHASMRVEGVREKMNYRGEFESPSRTKDVSATLEVYNGDDRIFSLKNDYGNIEILVDNEAAFGEAIETLEQPLSDSRNTVRSIAEGFSEVRNVLTLKPDMIGEDIAGDTVTEGDRLHHHLPGEKFTVDIERDEVNLNHSQTVYLNDNEGETPLFSLSKVAGSKPSLSFTADSSALKDLASATSRTAAIAAQVSEEYWTEKNKEYER